MTEPRSMVEPPKTILLATDLSPRCDRALDRAISLSELWQAKLVVLTVLEDFEPAVSDPLADLPSWRRSPDPLSLVRRRLHADIGPAADTATVMIEEGDPTSAILRIVESQRCDLIVTGTARGELFGRFILGTTTDRLLRRSRVPVLIVKNRPRRPYRHIVVATDFSTSSRHALEAAARYFPARGLTIFHAYDPPMPGVTDTRSSRREYRKIAEQEYEAFLRSAESGPTIGQHARLLIEYGSPSLLLRDYVNEKNVDLVVLGTHGRSAFFEIFIGSTAKSIVASLPCDALVVRDPRASIEGTK
jgi:nucleotide-binding universal stress UspA family protein